VGFFHQ
jgi:hypothetical protein